MAFPILRNIFIALGLFVLLAHCAVFSGEAVTTRFWDCCKPSCGWELKADFSRPVQTCKADGSHIDVKAGTGCKGGEGYLCSNQQPWAVNDTFSYGYAGVYFTGHPETENFWCCACYQLDFTDEPLRGKSMIVQASNTAYDITTTNRFSIAIPGGNQTREDGCTRQYNLDQSVFGQMGTGIGSKGDCDRLPQDIRDACRWRFDWYKDAAFPAAKFKRVTCPKELTERTQCIRNDEATFMTSSAPTTSSRPGFSVVAVLAIGIAGLLSV